MNRCIYTAEHSAHFRHGQTVYLSAADLRRDAGQVWIAFNPDGSQGCYGYRCDVTEAWEYEEHKQRRADALADLRVRP